jgi:transcription initiation factor TFIIH subunit 3
MMAGALSLALAYINRVFQNNKSVDERKDGGVELGRMGELGKGEAVTMTARILVVSVSGDLATQYVAIMNTIFGAQRKVCSALTLWMKRWVLDGGERD